METTYGLPRYQIRDRGSDRSNGGVLRDAVEEGAVPVLLGTRSARPRKFCVR